MPGYYSLFIIHHVLVHKLNYNIISKHLLNFYHEEIKQSGENIFFKFEICLVPSVKRESHLAPFKIESLEFIKIWIYYILVSLLRKVNRIWSSKMHKVVSHLHEWWQTFRWFIAISTSWFVSAWIPWKHSTRLFKSKLTYIILLDIN